MTKQYPDFETDIPAYAGGGSSAKTAPDSVAMPWDKIIDRKVKSSDDEDIGKVESIAPNYVEVKEGAVRKKHYFKKSGILYIMTVPMTTPAATASISLSPNF